MTTSQSVAVAETLKKLRLSVPLTIQQLAEESGVSPSYLSRIERGERLPSASILRRLAKPLRLGETELFTAAGYLSHRSSQDQDEASRFGRLDPYVATVLAQEPPEVQRAVIGVLVLLKSLAKYASSDFHDSQSQQR